MKLITVYTVTATSLDDGHRLNYGNYMNEEYAMSARDEFPEKMNAQICTYDAVMLDDGRAFIIPRDCLKFSDDKQHILRKLSKQEREILGV